jgi:hypothetical protein
VLNRDPAFILQQHDYDIIEGPIADDKIQNKINEYIDGIITKNDFLHELKYHEQTHQICFCTLNSLQMLKKTNQQYTNYLVRINEKVIEKLILDNQTDKEQATDLFYNSNTFAQLADESTLLYKKSWQEIYEMLKFENTKIQFEDLKILLSAKHFFEQKNI